MSVDIQRFPSAGPLIRSNVRPTRFISYFRWVWTGVKRQAPAVTGALIAAWTGFPLALWGMVVLAALGSLVGILGAEAVGLKSILGIELGFGIGIGVGVTSAFLGAIVGALSGLLLLYVYFILHPLILLGTLASGVAISAVFLWLIIATEPVVMRLRGYRELSRREQVLLHPMLEDAGRRMGLSTLPALWISDQQIPGAWAHMRGIVVTRGLVGAYSATEDPPLPDLDNAAITAILAHELHHWDACDVVGLTVVFACFYPIAIVVNAIAWVRERAEWLGVVLWCIAWPFWLSTKLIVIPLMTRRSRRYEYEADARAASLGDDYRLGLRRALDELSAWELPRTGWEDVIAATHPPIEYRLQMLEVQASEAQALERQPVSPVNDTGDGAAPERGMSGPTPSHPASMSGIERLRRKKASTSQAPSHPASMSGIERLRRKKASTSQERG